MQQLCRGRIVRNWKSWNIARLYIYIYQGNHALPNWLSRRWRWYLQAIHSLSCRVYDKHQGKPTLSLIPAIVAKTCLSDSGNLGVKTRPHAIHCSYLVWFLEGHFLDMRTPVGLHLGIFRLANRGPISMITPAVHTNIFKTKFFLLLKWNCSFLKGLSRQFWGWLKWISLSESGG